MRQADKEAEAQAKAEAQAEAAAKAEALAWAKAKAKEQAKAEAQAKAKARAEKEAAAKALAESRAREDANPLVVCADCTPITGEKRPEAECEDQGGRGWFCLSMDECRARCSASHGGKRKRGSGS